MAESRSKGVGHKPDQSLTVQVVISLKSGGKWKDTNTDRGKLICTVVYGPQRFARSQHLIMTEPPANPPADPPAPFTSSRMPDRPVLSPTAAMADSESVPTEEQTNLDAASGERAEALSPEDEGPDRSVEKDGAVEGTKSVEPVERV